MLNRVMSRSAALGVLLLVVTGLVALPTTPAAADPTCTPPAQASYNPSTGSYTCTVPGGGGGGGDEGSPGGGGGGTPAGPTCPLDQFGGISPSHADANPSAPYCRGENVCYDTDIIVPFRNPDGPKPSEDSKPRTRHCYDGIMGPPSSTPFWSGEEDEEPSPLEQAQEAIGNIDLGTPTVNVSPATRTLVNLDTWFWVTGQQETVSGSSAFGLVAIATFRSLSIDPGDGSGTFTCNSFPTTAAQAEEDCFHAYERSSRRGTAESDGRPAFRATARVVYDLRFEVGGEPLTIAGAPATLEGPVGATPVRVVEVQSTVTGIG